MWQDIALSIILIALNVALVPQIIKGLKTKKKAIAFSTGLITVTGIYFAAFIYFTLNLYFSMIIELIGGTLWLVLLIQSLIYKK